MASLIEKTRSGDFGIHDGIAESVTGFLSTLFIYATMLKVAGREIESSMVMSWRNDLLEIRSAVSALKTGSGGRSRRTIVALRALYLAMEADNAESPINPEY